eukprot:TRINITY_DN8400_c0_g1_i1.p1 TRINITY_DN8400_c0_g1~~TRINITY_DN8400_c0_g1_i1.p1  ORF type:complete len:270 (-),score=74.23 TRINITY_DN8400_c0_g1_i1:118-837(-)
MTSSCKIDTTWFPFDDQQCILKFGSWVYNGFKMNLKMQSDEMDLGTYVTNPKWAVVSAEGKRNEVIYECCPEPYLDIAFTIKLRRRTISYWTQNIIPSVAITLVSILTLLIPTPTPRFLVIFLLFILLSFTIPKDLPTPSLLSSLLGWCYFIMFSVLIHSIIVTAIANALFLKSSFINKMFRAIASRLSCGGFDEKMTEEEVRYKFAKSFDIFAMSCIFVAFIIVVGFNILSAPFLIVQ